MSTFKKRPKYNNVKTVYNGNTYDSKAEAKYAEILDGLLADGTITSIERQVKFPLKDRRGGNRLRYVADFIVIDKKGKEHIIDVKGVLTPATNIKLAYMLYVYKKPVTLVYTTGLKKFDTSFFNT